MTPLIFILLLLSFLFPQQERLKPELISVVIKKALKYNRLSPKQIHIIYDPNDSKYAKVMQGILKASASESDVLPELSDYSVVVFLGIDNAIIETMRQRHPNMLSISNAIENIESVSLSIYPFEKRTRLMINLERIKKEADFTAQFLKIATIWKSGSEKQN